jgi:eukaryotic-like serine/threonine-protein kinase
MIHLVHRNKLEKQMNSIFARDYFPKMESDSDINILQGRYQILNLLGEGGSSKTYRALDMQQQSEVAIKILNLRDMREWKTLELFKRESNILAQLDHPAIPRYKDFFYAEVDNKDFFCLVQSIIPYRSLYDWVESGHIFSEPELRQIAKQILEILEYIQSFTPPIIHRDIKPQNLLYNETGMIYLVDFGAVRDTYHMTLTGGSTVVGTYGYMAPEQFRGQALLATDLYGLGATLLYLASGEEPSNFPLRNMKIDFQRRIQISANFAKWLNILLEPIPEDRYQNAVSALDYFQGKAFTKIPRPQQPFSYLSQQKKTLRIIIPPVGLASTKSKLTFFTIVSSGLMWVFCYWLTTSTIFTIWSLFSLPLLLILPFWLVGKLWCYSSDITAQEEIVIDCQVAICTTRIAINATTDIIQFDQIMAVDRNKKGLQLKGNQQLSGDLGGFVSTVYSFGKYLDHHEQQWLMAAIIDHLRFSNSEL